MLAWAGQYWLGVGFGLLCTAAGAGFAYLRGRVRTRLAQQGEMEQRLLVLEKGVKAILYDRLWQAHNHYMQAGWISVPDLRNMAYLYEAYHALNGNGTGTKLYEDMRELPNTESGEVAV